MNRFAYLLDRLSLEPGRHGKLRLIIDYFKTTPDPDRGYALAALTGAFSFRHAKAGLIRGLIQQRVDPVLFALSYDFVGDLSETVALLWGAGFDEASGNHGSITPQRLDLADVVQALSTAKKADLPRLVSQWLDELDETGRWALLKLITGGLRVGVSARLAKTAAASLGGLDADAVEQVWHGLEAPYSALFSWLEGKGEPPLASNPAPFRPAMLAQPLNEKNLAAMNPLDFCAEWKWDGARLQISCGLDATGQRVMRFYSRTGEDMTAACPDLADALTRIDAAAFALDGELLVKSAGAVQNFNALQQRLNRKKATAKLQADYPLFFRAYDILALDGEDLRDAPFVERRRRLEDFVAKADNARLDLSPMVDFSDWAALAQARGAPEKNGAGADAPFVEGVMLKRRDSLYVAGRPTGPWFKWKRDPFLIDAVLMYAQRGHGKRSSLYSDFTFGVWRDRSEAENATENAGQELVPVGKAYFGFTDDELAQLDKYVRAHTSDRFGPVRVVEHTSPKGLVLEIAFEGLNRSARHKSGVAMRFPRIARIRWDKPAIEADRLETLEAMLS